MPYQILHIADVHLDMAFIGAESGLGGKRREQLREAFERSLRLAQERRVDAVCIAGDLYEDGRSGPDRAAYLRRVLGDIAPIRVFLAPGNHDPHTPASIYHQLASDPARTDNVFIFSRRAFAPVKLADGITLWGFAHVHDVDHDPAIGAFACEGAGTHVLLFHGSDRDRMPPGKDAIAPFSAMQIEQTGAAHAMLGHFHGMLQGPRYAYPGSLEPHTVAQDGRHTASLVSIADERVATEFIDVNRVRYDDVEVDVTPFGDSAELTNAVRARLGEPHDASTTVYSRVRLIGAAQNTLDLDAQAIQSDLRDAFPGIVVRDECEAFDYDAIVREGRTVRSEFVREMRETIAAASEAERPVYENALRFGMLAFSNRKIPA